MRSTWLKKITLLWSSLITRLCFLQNTHYRTLPDCQWKQAIRCVLWVDSLSPFFPNSFPYHVSLWNHCSFIEWFLRYYAANQMDGCATDLRSFVILLQLCLLWEDLLMVGAWLQWIITWPGFLLQLSAIITESSRTWYSIHPSKAKISTCIIICGCQPDKPMASLLAESYYNIYGNSAVGYFSHAHCIVLLYSVGLKLLLLLLTQGATYVAMMCQLCKAYCDYCGHVITGQNFITFRRCVSLTLTNMLFSFSQGSVASRFKYIGKCLCTEKNPNT